MSDIDFDAVNAANKGLTVCFIIAILAVNSVFILKILRKGRVIMYKPKSLTMISLAIGDIFLALFSLVFTARLAFEGSYYLHVPCSLLISVNVYSEFLISFVYGVGLIVLVVELVLRQIAVLSPNNTNKNIAIAIAFSATPWLLGLVIVLPLTMATMDWEICRVTDINFKRIRAQYWVSLVFLATTAFIACLIVFCTNSPDPTAQTTSVAPGTTSEAPPPYPGEDETNDSFNSNQRLAAGSYSSTVPVYTDQSPVISPPSTSSITREKKILMCAAIIYCVCVIPYAGHVLSIRYFSDKGWTPVAKQTVSMLFGWLMVCRSVLVPLLWVIWSTN